MEELLEGEAWIDTAVRPSQANRTATEHHQYSEESPVWVTGDPVLPCAALAHSSAADLGSLASPHDSSPFPGQCVCHRRTIMLAPESQRSACRIVSPERVEAPEQSRCLLSAWRFRFGFPAQFACAARRLSGSQPRRSAARRSYHYQAVPELHAAKTHHSFHRPRGP